jgi:hypothetical protein
MREENEALAHCAALARFGVNEEEIQTGEMRATGEQILPEDESEVLVA